MLLLGSGQKPGNVHQGHQGDVEGVAEPDEARRLVGGVDVEATGQNPRLIGNQPHAASVDAGKPDDDVGGVQGVHLHELPFVDQRGDDVPDVVGFPR